MTDKQLKKLTRGELLQMLIAQTEKNDILTEQLEEARRQLKNKKMVCEKAGSLAEASLQVSGVFEAAQEAAKHYYENIERMSAECDREKARIISKAEKEADDIINEAKKYSDDLRKEADDYWNYVYEKAQRVLNDRHTLNDLASTVERK